MLQDQTCYFSMAGKCYKMSDNGIVSTNAKRADVLDRVWEPSCTHNVYEMYLSLKQQTNHTCSLAVTEGDNSANVTYTHCV